MGVTIFHRFYLDNVKSLAAYFRRLGVARLEQIDDLVQESFVESYRNWDQLRSQDSARAWLYTIARRQLAKLIRKDRHLLLDFAEDAALHPNASTQTEPEQDLHAQRLCRIILECLLATRQDAKRQALTAYYLEERSFRDIAEETGIKISTLTTWCSRFRQECVEIINRRHQQGDILSIPALKKG